MINKIESSEQIQFENFAITKSIIKEQIKKYNNK